jgi:hypothetical protein
VIGFDLGGHCEGSGLLVRKLEHSHQRMESWSTSPNMTLTGLRDPKRGSNSLGFWPDAIVELPM